MKAFIAVLVLVLATVNADEWTPKTAVEIRAIRQECLKEHALSDEVISKMKQLEFPDEQPVREYLLCTAKKMDVFCTKMGYHADRLAKQFKMDLEEAEVLAIAESCIDDNKDGSAPDVWAFRGHQCMMKSKIGDRVRAYIKRKQEEEQKNA